MRKKITSPLKKISKPKSRLLKNRSLEFWKTEVWRSEKPKSGGRKNRSPEVGKTEVQRSGKPTLIILILTRII